MVMEWRWFVGDFVVIQDRRLERERKGESRERTKRATTAKDRTTTTMNGSPVLRDS
jgi:hypothetical protein